MSSADSNSRAGFCDVVEMEGHTNLSKVVCGEMQ